MWSSVPFATQLVVMLFVIEAELEVEIIIKEVPHSSG